MTQTEVDKFRQILRVKFAELARLIRNREAITIEKSADAVDEIQNAVERELAVRNLDRESALLRDVRAALGRIEGGFYGICLRCDEEISPKRLAAVPWAAYCIQCQVLADRRRAEYFEGDFLEEILENAA